MVDRRQRRGWWRAWFDAIVHGRRMGSCALTGHRVVERLIRNIGEDGTQWSTLAWRECPCGKVKTQRTLTRHLKPYGF